MKPPSFRGTHWGLAIAIGMALGIRGAPAQPSGGERPPRPRIERTGGPSVGDPLPRIELFRLDADGNTAGSARTAGRELLADPAKKRPVVLIFSSFT